MVFHSMFPTRETFALVGALQVLTPATIEVAFFFLFFLNGGAH